MKIWKCLLWAREESQKKMRAVFKYLKDYFGRKIRLFSVFPNGRTEN